jgi:hypothetical protein
MKTTSRSNQRAQYVRGLPQEKVEIKGRAGQPTANAQWFRIDGWEQDVCIPASQVFSVHREFATTGYDRMIITAWIAKQKGIIS